MTKQFIHFVNTGFNRGIYQTIEWWQHRLSIFENFTLTSLLNQTNKDFYLLINLRCDFPLKNELESLLKSKNIQYIFTYDDIPGDLEKQISQLPEINDAKYIYNTRIDSDDLYHKDVVNEIQSHQFKYHGALVFQKGYCYDCINRRLQHYFAVSPPMSTIMFPTDVFLDNKLRHKYHEGIKSHDQVFYGFDSEILSENKYIVLIHNVNNTSKYFENQTQLGRYEIDKQQHENILVDFGINSNTIDLIK